MTRRRERPAELPRGYFASFNADSVVCFLLLYLILWVIGRLVYARVVGRHISLEFCGRFVYVQGAGYTCLGKHTVQGSRAETQVQGMWAG